MGMEKFYMYAQLYESQRRFQRACDQINHLNVKLEDINNRYMKAKADDHKSYRYTLRMRLLVVEGTLKTFCHYACLKKNEVLDLRFKLYGENPDEGENNFSGFADDSGNETDDGEE